jgi:RNA polymerase sigma factor (sigma-70 family)
MLTNEQRQRYEKWVLAVGPHALAYARSLVRDPSRADDLVQECFFRLLRKADVYDLERDGLKLLFKSISNLCINQSTREKTLLSLDGIGEPESEPIPVPDLAHLRPEQILQHRELEAKIDQAMSQLTPLYRAAIELRALGFTKEQIGDSLEISTSYAGVLIHRGRQALAKELEKLQVKISEDSV